MVVNRKSSISPINNDGYTDRDIRNRKCNEDLIDGYKPTKHSHSIKDQIRIFYIKEKKELMKQEAQKKFEEKMTKEKQQAEAKKEFAVDKNFGKKNRNRKGNKSVKIN